MSDLLKEAIADAKAVRETALENAKAALEEAFTPQIKSMLSAKLKEDDMDDEAEEGMHDEDMDDDEAEEGAHEGDDDEVEELGPIAAAGLGALGAKMMDGEEAEEGAHEGEDDDEDAEEGMHEEDNLDLEAVIKELESELSEGDDEDDEDAEEGRGMKESEESEEAVAEGEEIEEEYEIDEATLEEEDEIEEEVDMSSGIGSGTGRGNTDASSGIGKGGQEKAKKMESVEAELAEYKEAVSFLKDKLHEVNILNAKLLYTNKLFKEYSLDNNQKLKVVETFDRAQTTREIKLVYTTMAEQLNENSGVIKRKSIKESASAPVSSTKPSKESSKVITEEAQVADRFRKLAGILKG